MMHAGEQGDGVGAAWMGDVRRPPRLRSLA